MNSIGLIAVDSDYPNLALMKISAYHKAQGDAVEWYTPFNHYDVVYMSKVFTFTEDWLQVIANADNIEKGGTGYDLHKELPAEIDHMQPDYSLYNIDPKLAYGFLTRGCPNKCKWCVVPKKEGAVHPYMDIEEIMQGGKKHAILMDNNILASDYGLEQLEKIIKNSYRVDFNQGMDARLVTDEIAKMLARVKWIRYPRFGCDTQKQVSEVERVMGMMDKHGYRGGVLPVLHTVTRLPGNVLPRESLESKQEGAALYTTISGRNQTAPHHSSMAKGHGRVGKQAMVLPGNRVRRLRTPQRV